MSGLNIPNAYYAGSVGDFIAESADSVLGALTTKSAFAVDLTQRDAWLVIFIPPGSASDPTRDPGFYDGTFEYLDRVGIPTVQGRSCGSGGSARVAGSRVRSRRSTECACLIVAALASRLLFGRA